MKDMLITGAILVDLKKAFVVVDYDILLEKLHDADIRDHELEWRFKSYLKNIAQATKIDEHNCPHFPQLPLGTPPQGLILGPLMFVIYIIVCHLNLITLNAKYTCMLMILSYYSEEEALTRLQNDMQRGLQRAEE